MAEMIHVLTDEAYLPGSVVLGCSGDLLCIFYEWQTLSTGIIALIAAVITAIFLHRQISVQKSHLDH